MELQKACYTYVLMDPTISMEWEFNGKKYYYKPFYVGMGSGYRISYHGTSTDLKNNRNKFKTDYLLNLKSKGVDFIREKIGEKMSPDEACSMEIELIVKFGRMCNKSGILTNLTKGGDIYTSGAQNPNAKTVYQYSEEGVFIKKHDCIASIFPENLSSKSSIATTAIKNTKNYPKKLAKAVGYLWFEDFKGYSIKEELQKNDNRVHKYDGDFNLLKIYSGAKEMEQDGYSDSSVYSAVKNKNFYKGSYWSRGILRNMEEYGLNKFNCKKCYQYSLKGDFIKEHICINSVPRTANINIDPTCITDCCIKNEQSYPKKRYKSAGYIWMYTYEGDYLAEEEKTILYQWDRNFNLINHQEDKEWYKTNLYNKQGIARAIKYKQDYKGYFWSYYDKIEDTFNYRRIYWSYCQTDLEGNVINTFDRRSDIPSEFDKDMVCNATITGKIYEGYKWKKL